MDYDFQHGPDEGAACLEQTEQYSLVREAILAIKNFRPTSTKLQDFCSRRQLTPRLADIVSNTLRPIIDLYPFKLDHGTLADAAMWLFKDLRLYPAGPLGVDVNAYCKGAAVKY